MQYIWLMSFVKVLIFIFSTSFLISEAQSDSVPEIIQAKVHSGVKFTENKGQWEKQILFRAQLDGGALYLEKKELPLIFTIKKSTEACIQEAYKTPTNKKQA